MSPERELAAFLGYDEDEDLYEPNWAIVAFGKKKQVQNNPNPYYDPRMLQQMQGAYGQRIQPELAQMLGSMMQQSTNHGGLLGSLGNLGGLGSLLGQIPGGLFK